MKVIEFDTQKGVYRFELESIETELHSHPVIEVIFATEGTFAVSTASSSFTKLTFAVINSNVPHQLIASTGKLRVIMIENSDKLFGEFLDKLQLTLHDGIFIEKAMNNRFEEFDEFTNNITSKRDLLSYDKRVKKLLEYIDLHDVEYNSLVDVSKRVTDLSESRISHLFRKDVGISLKKYLLWSKLKKAIQIHLNKKEDLFTALIESGFYDQPHFSRAFKVMLGISPSKVYNSRILQVSQTDKA